MRYSIHILFCDEFFSLFQRFTVASKVNRKNCDIIIVLVGLIHFVKLGKFLQTFTAPGRPEIDQDDLPGKIGTFDLPAVGAGQFELSAGALVTVNLSLAMIRGKT